MTGCLSVEHHKCWRSLHIHWGLLWRKGQSMTSTKTSKPWHCLFQDNWPLLWWQWWASGNMARQPMAACWRSGGAGLWRLLVVVTRIWKTITKSCLFIVPQSPRARGTIARQTRQVETEAGATLPRREIGFSTRCSRRRGQVLQKWKIFANICQIFTKISTKLPIFVIRGSPTGWRKWGLQGGICGGKPLCWVSWLASWKSWWCDWWLKWSWSKTIGCKRSGGLRPWVGPTWRCSSL